jgi:hypothetical protein
MKITEAKYAAEQGVAEDEMPGMEAKWKECCRESAR